jgi:hypothetical protein
MFGSFFCAWVTTRMEFSQKEYCSFRNCVQRPGPVDFFSPERQ